MLKLNTLQHKKNTSYSTSKTKLTGNQFLISKYLDKSKSLKPKFLTKETQKTEINDFFPDLNSKILSNKRDYREKAKSISIHEKDIFQKIKTFEKRSSFIKSLNSNKENLSIENKYEKVDKEIMNYLYEKLNYKRDISFDKIMESENINNLINTYIEEYIYQKPKEIEIIMKKTMSVFLNENIPFIFFYKFSNASKNRLEIS